MRIEKHTIDMVTRYWATELPSPILEEFADQHGLTMVIRECLPGPDPKRFYACFKNAEVKNDDSMLGGKSGNGETPEEAMADYGKQISGKLLIIDAGTAERREIYVPVITTKKQEALKSENMTEIEKAINAIEVEQAKLESWEHHYERGEDIERIKSRERLNGALNELESIIGDKKL